MSSTPHTELIVVLHEVRGFLARPGNEFLWSSWDNCEDAVRHIDDLVAQIESGKIPKRLDLTVLFAPTGDLQEVAESSGWGREFLALAEKFDAAIERL